MKKFYPTLVLSFLLSCCLFAQGELAKKTYERWDGDNAVWITERIETWDYDQIGREILYTSWRDYQGPYAPHNRVKIESVYDEKGNLTEQKNRQWGDTLWQEQLIRNTFNNQNELIESLEKYSNSETARIAFTKEVFEKNETENRRTKTNFYTTGSPENWIPDHKRDSFFDDNGCLTKQTIVNFNEDGSVMHERWWTENPDDICRPLSTGYWSLEVISDTMVLHSRNFYDYLNGGKTVKQIYERYNVSTNIWELKSSLKTETDDENREIRWFYEDLGKNIPDTTLKTYSYTTEGELALFKQFATSHNTNKPRNSIRLDSFIYYYDDEQTLILKEQFEQYYSNPVRKISTRYKYYCNGKLKTEYCEELPQVSRITYEYHGKSECFDEEKPPFLEIFPNPSDGSFRIQSNLLGTGEVTVRVYSILGQEVWSEKINRVTERAVLNLPDLPGGSYVISLISGNEQVSEKIVLK